jgi:phosphohistidine phosphatase
MIFAKRSCSFRQNPGIIDLANYLIDGNFENMPTCSVFSVELQVTSWRQLSEAGARFALLRLPQKTSD